MYSLILFTNVRWPQKNYRFYYLIQLEKANANQLWHDQHHVYFLCLVTNCMNFFSDILLYLSGSQTLASIRITLRIWKKRKKFLWKLLKILKPLLSGIQFNRFGIILGNLQFWQTPQDSWDYTLFLFCPISVLEL